MSVEIARILTARHPGRGREQQRPASLTVSRSSCLGCRAVYPCKEQGCAPFRVTPSREIAVQGRQPRERVERPMPLRGADNLFRTNDK